jgi:hypothetical protein
VSTLKATAYAFVDEILKLQRLLVGSTPWLRQDPLDEVLLELARSWEGILVPSVTVSREGDVEMR